MRIAVSTVRHGDQTARRKFWTIVTAPLIYSLLIPFAVLDLWATIYQHVCFRAYGVPRVRRADYLLIDRHRLPYLDIVGKLNCTYCGYSNGVLAYVREIASRTEQYWCPIKHAVERPDPHRRYAAFSDFGDARSYDEQAERLRNQLRAEGRSP